MSTESIDRERFLCVEIPRRSKHPQATTTATTIATTTTTTRTRTRTRTARTAVAAAATNTPTHAETSFTHTSPRSRRRSSVTTRASAAVIARLPKKLKEKLYRLETIEILEAVAVPPYIRQKERTQRTHQKPQAPSSRRPKGSTHPTSNYENTPSSPSSPSEPTHRRTIIMDSDEESDGEHQHDEDYEEGSEMSMSSLVRRTKLAWNTTKVAQKGPRLTKLPNKGKSNASSPGSSHRNKTAKLRKRLLEEVELDEDAGIALLPAKRTRNLSNSSFRQRLQRLRSKGFANGGHEEGSSSESSDGSDSSSDDSDIPDSQGNIASFVIQDNEEEAERVLAQIPEKFRRDKHQTPKNDFKLYIEYLFWLVFDKHALDNQDSKYDAPVQRIMKILGTYQSTLSSSGIWSPIFLSLVDQRPKLRRVPIVDEEETFCAACKNISHKAQSVVTLFGAEYEVPMKPSELDRFSTMFSPSAGTQRIDANSDGQEFRFKLGTTCTKRSMLYHQARHFSYNCVWKIIDHCIREMKDQSGQTPAQRLAKKRNKTDRVDAASLVTRLQGVTSRLWSEFDDLKSGITKLPSSSK